MSSSSSSSSSSASLASWKEKVSADLKDIKPNAIDMKSEMPPYIIVKAATLNGLALYVGDKMVEGYLPLGSPFVREPQTQEEFDIVVGVMNKLYDTVYYQNLSEKQLREYKQLFSRVTNLCCQAMVLSK